MNDNDKIEGLYERVMNVVAESHRLIEAPQVPDMEHIQTEVALLCEEINALPIERRVGYAEKFKQLFDALSDLEVKLTEKRDEVEKMLSETDQHKKATSAYAKTSHIDQSDES